MFRRLSVDLRLYTQIIVPVGQMIVPHINLPSEGHETTIKCNPKMGKSLHKIE